MGRLTIPLEHFAATLPVLAIGIALAGLALTVETGPIGTRQPPSATPKHDCEPEPILLTPPPIHLVLVVNESVMSPASAAVGLQFPGGSQHTVELISADLATAPGLQAAIDSSVSSCIDGSCRQVVILDLLSTRGSQD